MKGRENIYVKLYQDIDVQRLKRGMEVKKRALHKSATVKKMMSMLDTSYLSEIVVYDDDAPVTTLKQEQILEIVKKGELYAPLSKYI